MKKVLFVITKSNWGGAQRYVFDLATNLSSTDFDVCVAFGGTGQAGAAPGLLQTRLEAAKVRTLFVPSFMRNVSWVHEVQLLRELYTLCTKEKPDVVHLNSSKAGAVGALAARLARVPHIVFTSHGLAFEEDRNVFARSAIYFATWMTFVLSTCVITITHSNYARARRMWGCTKKVQLVHNGIAPLAFLSQEDARAALLQQTGSAVDHDALWLGSIGEYTWNKGLHFAIRAVSDLTQQGKKVVLFLLGDGEERTFFETLIDQESLAGKVFLAGFTPDAHRFLPAFDVFVVPSIKEGLPYVLLEAGQAGSAVVATRTGGIPDIVEHQQTGLLVQPKHEHALAKSIGTLVDTAQLRTTYAQALRARTTSEFSLARMIEKTSTIYKS